MTIAVFTDNDGQSGNLLSFNQPVGNYAISQLEGIDLSDFQAVFIIGSPEVEPATSLSPPQVNTLWSYVESGGFLYGELIEAFDFPTSRLFGWKQEFPRSVRTSEKLRLLKRESSDSHSDLMEWSGVFQKGFSFEGETWMMIGTFRSTHAADTKDENSQVPGMIIGGKGKGRTVYASFPLLQQTNPWSYRPYWLWTELFHSLNAELDFPVQPSAPEIAIAGRINTAEDAVNRNAAWFLQSGIMPDPSGSLGVYENVHSILGEIIPDYRPDCHVHSALFFHMYGRYTGDSKWSERSRQLLSFILDGGYQDLRPDSASYGFFKWYGYPEAEPEQIFTDDNAWVCFVLLYLYRKTGISLYKERGMLTAQALLQTQQKNGLRANCLSGKLLREVGREGGAYSKEASMNPHFESIAHAALIQAYLVSHEQAYLDTALKGSIRLLDHMDKLVFMYSRTSGFSRFLLPLTYLGKHDRTGRIQQGTDDILRYLIACQHESGAIEEADNPDPEKYGKEDTGVFRFNGEGIADQLYTNNFLLMNSWEGWKQTHNPTFKKLYEQLSGYLASIQIHSRHERFHGGWMRAFDLHHEEYFGNNGDTGWGPYCMESGWTNALIGCGFLAGLLDESFFS